MKKSDRKDEGFIDAALGVFKHLSSYTKSQHNRMSYGNDTNLDSTFRGGKDSNNAPRAPTPVLEEQRTYRDPL